MALIVENTCAAESFCENHDTDSFQESLMNKKLKRTAIMK